MREPTYLGDGLYAEYADGYHVRLYTEIAGSDRIEVIQVFLSPDALAAFERFVAQVREQGKEKP